MRTYTGSAGIQRTFTLAVPLVAIAWLATVPTVLTVSNFLALAGLVIAFAWVANAVYVNGRPTDSLAQVLHDTEHNRSPSDPRTKR